MEGYKVFDKGNPERFLGTFMASLVASSKYEVSLLAPFQRITFEVGFQTESEAEAVSARIRKILTIEEKVLLTDASLEDLMKLDRFTLPGESERKAEYRRAGYY